MATIEDVILEAANRYGVDPQVLTRIAQMESGLRPNAKNPNSSAGGLFQFIDSTAERYGGGNRYDPVRAADMAGRLTKDNIAHFTQAMGRPPTGGEIYLMHQQGAGGATNLLRNPDTPIQNLLSAKAFANNAGYAGMTGGQFANQWIKRFEGTGRGARQPPKTLPGGQITPQAGPALGDYPERDQLGDMMAFIMRPKAGQATPMGVPPVQIAPPSPPKRARLEKILDPRLVTAI